MAATRVETETKIVREQSVAWLTLDSDNGLHVIDTEAANALGRSVEA